MIFYLIKTACKVTKFFLINGFSPREIFIKIVSFCVKVLKIGAVAVFFAISA